jgi:transcriptional regulator
MYSPPYAIQADSKENEDIIRKYPFATIVYSQNNVPESFHLPLSLQSGKLIGHMARANPAWKALDGTCALFIFHGPHHYISPDSYGTEGNVPTWNYVSVHVRGIVKITEDHGFLKRAILLLSSENDPAFDIEKNISNNEKLLANIVGLEVQIQEVFGKFKLAQSKSEEERCNVINALEEAGANELAEEMRKTIRSYR